MRYKKSDDVGVNKKGFSYLDPGPDFVVSFTPQEAQHDLCNNGEGERTKVNIAQPL